MTILGVPAHDSDENMQAFVDRFGLEEMTQLVDDGGAIWRRFGVVGQPAWVFVAPDGTTETVGGVLGDEALDARIDGLLDAS